MYSKIMVPVDLTHLQELDKALNTAADLARHYKIPICYVGITSAAPSAIAHNPAEYEQKLQAFSRKQGEQHGHQTESKAVVSHDPTVDINDSLMKATTDIGADLVVMASHVPGLTDYVWPSHGGTLASHSRASVFVVR